MFYTEPSSSEKSLFFPEYDELSCVKLNYDKCKSMYTLDDSQIYGREYAVRSDKSWKAPAWTPSSR